MRKLDFCPCENKGADQLCSYCTADLHLCFHYMDTESTIPLLLKSKFQAFSLFSETVQTYLCQIWLEILKTSFLIMALLKFRSLWLDPYGKMALKSEHN